MNFAFAHDFDIDVAGYWKIFLAADFNKEMFAELRMKDYKVLKQEDDGKHFRRIQTLEPTTPIPGFLQSIIKSTATRDRRSRLVHERHGREEFETQMFKDRFHMQGKILGVAARRRQSAAGASSKAKSKCRWRSSAARSRRYMMSSFATRTRSRRGFTKRWIEKSKSPQPQQS
jgi:hypothetical protein